MVDNCNNVEEFGEVEENEKGKLEIGKEYNDQEMFEYDDQADLSNDDRNGEDDERFIRKNMMNR